MKNIFVGNLSFTTTEETIRSLFAAHGTVERVNMVTDRDTGQPRGFCFVEMTNDAGAILSLELVQITGQVIVAGHFLKDPQTCCDDKEFEVTK